MLDSQEVQTLKNLIRDSFRIRENQDPVYVDLGGNLQRFSSAQHQVLFGRRGSGKSCLQVHFLRQAANNRDPLAIYIGVDEIKRLGFPDVLIRILLEVFQRLPGAKGKFFGLLKTPQSKIIKDLSVLLDNPEDADVSQKDSRGSEGGLDLAPAVGAPRIGLKASRGRETTTTFKSKKLDHLERHLQNYKSAIRTSIKGTWPTVFILLDDFYLIKKDLQPHVIDYLHRLLRGTDAYLKVGTIRHRTQLRVHEGQTIGVELGQDVEEISLDKTFEDFEGTNSYLHSMLSEMGNAGHVNMDVAGLFNSDAPRALTLASGGVPRDFLNIFVDAIDLSVRAGKRDRLTPTFIYKSAAQHSYKSKLANIQEEAGYDAEKLGRVYADLVAFCLKDKKKTAFLISIEDARQHPDQHELLQQLMDFKLLHVISQNTSAASGRQGRYVAYTLDFSIFMEPRRRGIEIVEFWKVDDQRRPIGVRESPDYPLARAADAAANADSSPVEEIVDSVEAELEVDVPETGAPD
ncbi:hypothetical protein [Luteimonas saliphila]|uniref:hypothetical protein n=1 Tax=Luteimonas saliphila TaxID=2804919 RepID=UPI00192DEF4D|nr:hypothetical protein [Luteimonas saliphila]